MRFPIKTTVALLLLAGIGGAGYWYVPAYWKNLYKPNYRQAEVSRGPILFNVNATGTVKPVQSISVGSFVSGPIDKLYVDFNDIVTKGQLLAKVDPRIYEAAVSRDKAMLATKEADLKRVEALLSQANNDYKRAVALRKEHKDFISDAEMDQYKFSRMSLEAQLVVAKASVEQAQANLERSETDLKFAEIRSPVDGVIIDRKIDEGQTVVVQFQTQELFVVAPNLEDMHIDATVDEADIGLITTAQRKNMPVRFTVDAYPDDLFNGEIWQIRQSSTMTQNVVTYPVIVKAHNPDLKLLPGMTANLSFEVDEVKDVLRIPNAALRFYPQRDQVHPNDRDILDGTANDSNNDNNDSAQRLTAKEKAEARQRRNRRHVWVVEGDYLRAVEIVTGLSDNRYTQMISGELKEGQKLVTGIQPTN